jgi:hypothetical protein
MGDNGSNNDTLVRALADEQVFEERNDNAQEHRLRCVGYVIHRVVNAFWFGEVDRMILPDTVIVTRNTIAEWRKIRPWRKGHNITTYILASPQRRQESKRLGGDSILHRANFTRWITGYTMIQSLFRNRDVVDIFRLRHREQQDEDRLFLDVREIWQML